jgi:hypothetical protein
MRRLFPEEPIEGSNEAIRLLDMRQVAAIRDEFETAPAEAGDRLSRLRGREHPIGGAANDERQRLHGGNLIQHHLTLPYYEPVW